MASAIGDLLSLAVIAAVSPLVVAAIILMATSGKGRTNGTAFVLGYFGFTLLFTGLLAWTGQESGADEEGSGASLTIGIIEILLGVLMLGLSYTNWRKRHETEMPRWLSALDRLTPAKALGLGVLLAGPISPKNLPILIAAAGRVAQSGLGVGQGAVVILVFALVASVALIIPWLISVLAPDRTERLLSGLRLFLIEHNAAIMTVLFLVLGAKMLGAGLADVF